MRASLACVVLLLLTCVSLHGQKVLQLEKMGSLKTGRFYPGEEITFKIVNDDKGWYTRMITDIDVDRGYLFFFNHHISIDSIEMIQLKRSKGLQFIGGALQVGGANTVIFSITYPLFNDSPPDWVGVGSGVAIMGIGTLLRSLFKTKKFVIGKRKRLRLLDLNFGPPVLPPIKT